MAAEVRRAADAIKAKAEQIAPRTTSYYEKHFVVVEGDGPTKVGNTDFAAHMVEWGSVNNVAYAPLRRAVRAAGFHLKEAPKP